jgi:hypothetical protein
MIEPQVWVFTEDELRVFLMLMEDDGLLLCRRLGLDTDMSYYYSIVSKLSQMLSDMEDDSE